MLFSFLFFFFFLFLFLFYLPALTYFFLESMISQNVVNNLKRFFKNNFTNEENFLPTTGWLMKLEPLKIWSEAAISFDSQLACNWLPVHTFDLHVQGSWGLLEISLSLQFKFWYSILIYFGYQIHCSIEFILTHLSNPLNF